ncbi:hypothetical protein DAEQUDRAFT_406662 [Daedalea quercina L-15889]|uniref:Uncharacterized protein n=1 Tax=Daedalea quercina L-15889 TaxID=1314783 RepID=A0A165NNJ6_9APHY|nr:hypothetical protein DAEQUDRAFT_406662 [Daedalea quercina L-15889]
MLLSRSYPPHPFSSHTPRLYPSWPPSLPPLPPPPPRRRGRGTARPQSHGAWPHLYRCPPTVCISPARIATICTQRTHTVSSPLCLRLCTLSVSSPPRPRRCRPLPHSPSKALASRRTVATRPHRIRHQLPRHGMHRRPRPLECWARVCSGVPSRGRPRRRVGPVVLTGSLVPTPPGPRVPHAHGVHSLRRLALVLGPGFAWVWTYTELGRATRARIPRHTHLSHPHRTSSLAQHDLTSLSISYPLYP